MAIRTASKRNADQEYGKPAKAVILDSATNEVVFAVVGYVGSGTSEIASALKGLLEQERLEGGKFDVEVLFRPFTGVAPRLYRRAFLKDRDLKDSRTGEFKIGVPEWGSPWQVHRASYVELEAALARTE
jgi:hypothetical protein